MNLNEYPKKEVHKGRISHLIKIQLWYLLPDIRYFWSGCNHSASEYSIRTIEEAELHKPDIRRNIKAGY